MSLGRMNGPRLTGKASVSVEAFLDPAGVSVGPMSRWKTTGEDWMGAPAAAKRLGVQLVTLYGIINRGELPAHKFGRVIRLQRADVDAYLERCRVQPGTLSHLYPPGEYGDPPRKR